VTLTGAKKGDTPQVHMVALFYEDRPGVSFSPEPKQSPTKARAAARRKQAAVGGDGDANINPDSATAAAVESGQSGGGGQQRADGAAGVDGPGGSDAGQARAAVAAGPPARHPTAGLPDFGSPGRNPADDGPFRRFALTVDVRSFQSSKRLPLSSACVYVQAVLPADLIGARRRQFRRTAPT
jgi:centrosomal protein CEP120